MSWYQAELGFFEEDLQHRLELNGRRGDEGEDVRCKI